MPKAPRRCPADGCTNLIRHTRYCPDHTQSWRGPRTASSEITSTSRWQRLRPEILRRDGYQCQIQGPTCTGHADQVDKIIAPGRGGDPFDPNNLRAACSNCNLHKARTIDRK